MNVLILGANGQIARIVEDRILSEDKFSNVNLTLFLRNSSRLSALAGNPRVKLIDGDLDDLSEVEAAMKGIDVVFIAVADTNSGNTITKNVITAMKKAGVSRVIESSSIGIYGEEPTEADRKQNEASIGAYFPAMRRADELLQESGLDYTTARYAWLNNSDNMNYKVTVRGEKFASMDGSRKSMADVILKIIADPKLYSKETIGISDK